MSTLYVLEVKTLRVLRKSCVFNWVVAINDFIFSVEECIGAHLKVQTSFGGRKDVLPFPQKPLLVLNQQYFFPDTVVPIFPSQRAWIWLRESSRKQKTRHL